MEVDERPWGRYEVLLDKEDVKVKIITVKPGQRLSYQYHEKRKEHWTIVSGVATVTLNDRVTRYLDGQVVEIPLKAKHRVENESKDEDLVFIEVQTGTYFGEDDIVRIEDDYDRV